MAMKFVQVKDLRELSPGDTIRHISKTLEHETLIVTANYGDRVTAVATQDVTNPSEWMVLRCGGNR